MAPDDIAMLAAYGDCLGELGRGDESDAHYRAAIKVGGPEHVVDLAKSRVTRKSEERLRSSGEIRKDILEYMEKTLDSPAICIAKVQQRKKPTTQIRDKPSKTKIQLCRLTFTLRRLMVFG
jgi:hypothetical protein